MSRAAWLLLLLPFAGMADAALREEVALTLRDASLSPDLYLVVELEPESPYVQQQTVLRSELWQAIPLDEPRFDELAVPHALVEGLGESERTELRDGRSYRVTTRQYALMPQRSGAWSVPPLVLRAGVPGAASSEPLRVVTPGMKVTVRPAPGDVPTEQWLPSPWLHVDWDWPAALPLEVGRSVDVTYRIRAGNLSAVQLPELLWAPQPGLITVPRRTRVATEFVALELAGNREWTFSLVPTRAGDYTLPGFELPWWSTLEHRPEVAYIPPLTLNVVGRGEVAKPQARQRQEVIGAIVAGLLLLGALLRWRRHLRAALQRGVRIARFRRACRRNDADAAAALLRPSDRANASGALAKAIGELDRCRFGPNPAVWDGASLWRAWRSRKSRSARGPDASLPVLYPTVPPPGGDLE